MENEYPDINFRPFGAGDVTRYKDHFTLRRNRTCDSVPLCLFLWQHYYPVSFADMGDGLLFLLTGDDDSPSGCIPYCKEEDLPGLFRLQEEYFNHKLGKPVRVYFGDEEGVDLLRAAGLLENYTVTEETDMRDYLYDADKLRTLEGRKYSKKRSHLKKFLSEYEGRWEYRSLHAADREDILAFLRYWVIERLKKEEGTGIDKEGNEFDPESELNAEELGLKDVMNSTAVMDAVKLGGIYVDGQLKAFSMGMYNEKERMAVIEVEKADQSVEGLYQAINREFLVHEFPDALIVNREDDVGLPGLRQSKLSYYPTGFARKYTLVQNDYDTVS